MVYMVKITETLEVTLPFEADSEDESLFIAEQRYRNEEIILTERNHVDTNFNIWRDSNENQG